MPVLGKGYSRPVRYLDFLKGKILLSYSHSFITFIIIIFFSAATNFAFPRLLHYSLNASLLLSKCFGYFGSPVNTNSRLKVNRGFISPVKYVKIIVSRHLLDFDTVNYNKSYTL